MADNPLLQLESYGQSIWLDLLRREMTRSGELKKLIDEDGLSGETSNPSIFEKAISGSHDYDADIRTMALEGRQIDGIYEGLTVKDVQEAADLFRPVFQRANGRDGFVSLEVSPKLAHDTQGSNAEARRLWEALDRPNVMIKIPGTREGIPAIYQSLRDGVNINITLLFGLPRYREVLEAWLSALEDRLKQGEPIDQLNSVASFFLSRIDVLIDPMLEKIIAEGGRRAEQARQIHGQVAIASAKVAYEIYQEMKASERYKKLVAAGAYPQRLLWASTSTKNPAYSDVKYVEPLIGPETINTMPLETINAYRDHGHPEPRLSEGVEEAHRVLDTLEELGISIDQVTQQLEDEGVEKFDKAFGELMQSLSDQRQAAISQPVDRQTFVLGDHQTAVDKRMQALDDAKFGERLWRKDPTLWKKDPQEQKSICDGLGWLHVPEKMEENVAEINAFVDQVKAAGFQHVVHMGMGGSSLAPLVLSRVFGSVPGGIPLTVLDTTSPATIRQIRESVPLEKTLFIVASKSGTTAEPAAFDDYFYDQVKQVKGSRAGDNFVAITDPDTPLVRSAQERGFRRVFLNYPDIGGRYSALSYFGMVPAALMGIDIGQFLSCALRMEHACDACIKAADSPGLSLGAAMGELGRDGIDKVTFITPGSLAPLGMWLEQLIAESTGKEGKGLLPVAEETHGEPQEYGQDRFFAYFKLTGEEDLGLDGVAGALAANHRPIVKIRLDDLIDLAEEFYRWEVATATAGAVLGINAFDQPNVQESKDNTNHLLEMVNQQGHLPEEESTLTQNGIRFYGGAKGASARDVFQGFIGQGKPGDYIALLAYLPETDPVDEALADLRLTLRKRTRLATTVGYGPRYLHSTGQYHKGGPNTGLFLLITGSGQPEVPIPGRKYGFGTFQKAQAIGDLQALRRHDRRVLHIDLSGDYAQAIETLKELVI